MAVFDKLKRCSFGGVDFPVEEITVSCATRDAVHEYPYQDGGAVEKMGRKLYVVNVRANFQATFATYPNLWPAGLATLRRAFELQLTQTLVIPTIGDIQAYCTNWSQTQTNKVLSGESASFSFRENQDNDVLSAAIIAAGVSTVAAALQRFQVAADEITPQPDIFDKIKKGVNTVLAIKDQAELHAALLESKVAALSNLFKLADSTVKELQHPENLGLIKAFKELWRSVNKLSQTFNSRADNPTVTYTTPRRMTAQEVSLAAFGNTKGVSKVLDALAAQGHSIDAFNIPAGTVVKVTK